MPTPDAATQAWLARIAPDQQLAAAAATHAELLRWALGWAMVILVLALMSRWDRLARLRSARALPSGWPVWCGLAIAAAAFAWTFLPYALGWGMAGLPPAPPGSGTAALRQLIAETGLPASGVLLSPASGFDADVTGGFGRAFVSVTADALKAPPAELRAYVAHLIGHYVHHDMLALAAARAGLTLLGTLAVAAGLAPLSRLIGARGAERPSDPAGLPVAALIAAVAVVLATPLLAGLGRAVNVRADRYAIEHSSPDGLAAVLVRTWDHRAVSPGPLEEALLYGHPPLAARIRQAMAARPAR